MKQTTRLPSASSAPGKSFDFVLAESHSALSTSSSGPCKVYAFDDFLTVEEATPPGYTDIRDLAAEWSADESRRADLQEARRWFADTFLSEDGDTLRTLRLRKGWTQADLAERIGTSQPHIARIERGSDNLLIDTCRRLAEALEIDMNTLDGALRRQQALQAAKQRT